MPIEIISWGLSGAFLLGMALGLGLAAALRRR